MAVQIITTPAGERLALLPEADYVALVSAAEDHADRATVEAFRRKLAGGEEELVPSGIVDRLLGGENRVKVWREHRGLTAKALADKAGLAQAFVSQIETGKRDGTVETLRKLAEALNLTLDDLAGAHSIVEPKAEPVVYERIEQLVRLQPGLTEMEIAAELFGDRAYQQKVNADCRWLVKSLRVDRRGRGGVSDPYRYHPIGPADLGDEKSAEN